MDRHVMYLVAPSRPEKSPSLVLADAFDACRACERDLGRDLHAAAFAAWRAQNITKVCLRARPEEMTAVEALDHVRRGQVICLPPRPRDSSEPQIARLRPHQGGPLRPDGPITDLPDRPLALIDAQLELTLGKAAAQVAHAATLSRDRTAATRRPLVALADPDDFTAAARAPGAVTVTDAGHTQVAPGTVTVVLLPAGGRPDWPGHGPQRPR